MCLFTTQACSHALSCCVCRRGFAFSLFYSFMNMAALLCASVLDLFRVKLRHGFNIESLPANHFLNDGTRLLLFMGEHQAVSQACPFLLSNCILVPTFGNDHIVYNPPDELGEGVVLCQAGHSPLMTHAPHAQA